MVGALPRLQRKAMVRDAVWLALGLAILANSRPYEGLLLALAAATALLIWLAGPRRPRLSVVLGRVVAPIVLILAIAAAATGYYYYRVTGVAFRMTYQVNRGTYSPAPYFLWQDPRPEPVYHHAVMRDFYQREFGYFEESRTLDGFPAQHGRKDLVCVEFLSAGLCLQFPCLALPWILRDRRMRFPLLAGALFLLGNDG